MQTNFAALQPQEKLVWSRDVWSAARDQAFFTRFTGQGQNNVCQRITELTKTEKGSQAIMQLVADLVEDGTIGDNEQEGQEEALQNYYQIINIDRIAHQVRNKGELSDQKSVINFREQAKDKLAYWLANRLDQLSFLTLSGISYAYRNNGAARTSSAFANLSFAADVHASTSARALMWTGSALATSSTGSITSAYTLSYAAIVDLVAYAKSHYVKPLTAGGKEYYVFFCQPGVLAQLKKDADYQRAVVQLGPKMGTDSPWFTGGTVTIDGLVIHEHRLVYNTKGLADGSKWGSGGHVDGTRSLLCGAQAMGMVDLAPPKWVEKLFQYENQQGISVSKMLGLLKPEFYSIYEGSVQDFSCITLDSYLQ